MPNIIFVSIVGFALAALCLLYRLCAWLFGSKGGNEGFIANAKPSLLWFDVSQCVSRWFFKFYNRFEIHNYELVPKDKQFVTVANHASNLDGFIIGGAVRSPVYIMVKKEAFDNPIQGFYLRKVLCFPVDRSKVDMKAIKYAMKVIDNGWRLGLFPEGTRNREGKVSEFKSGAIKLALKKKLPIIPAYIKNSHKLVPGKVAIKPVKLEVYFLPPIDTKAELAAGKNEADILDMLYERICTKGTEVMGYDVRASAR